MLSTILNGLFLVEVIGIFSLIFYCSFIQKPKKRRNL